MEIVNAMFSIVENFGDWLVGFLPSLVQLFWTVPEGGGAGSLTFLGTTAVISFSISLTLLVFNIIKDFLKLRS